MEKKNVSMCEVSIDADLHHQAVRRFKKGMRPTMLDCILLADYFDMNPNEMLNLAGWPALKVFSVQTENAEHLSPEAVNVALKISRIKKQAVRQKVAKAISTLAEQYLELEEAHGILKIQDVNKAR